MRVTFLIFLAAFLFFASFAARPVFAGDESSDVQVNLEVLRGLPSGVGRQKPAVPKLHPPPKAPAFVPSEFGAPEFKPYEPLRNYQPPRMFENAPPPVRGGKFAASPLPAVPTGEVVAERLDKPPVPVQRPGLMHASESFIRKARQDMAKILPDVFPSKPGKPAPVKTETGDVVRYELVEPTAEQILSSIENSKAFKDVEPAAGGKAEPRVTLAYQKGAIVLESAMKKQLEQDLIGQALAVPQTRLEIQAFAALPAPHQESAARRLSLARALEIRDFLATRRIDPGQVDVQALGYSSAKIPPDRVDIYIIVPPKH